MSAGKLFAEHSARLMGAHDFAVFGELAEAMIAQGNDAAAANAEQIEGLLRMSVSALAADPASQQAAAQAIDAYVAEVWPIRSAAGLGTGGAAKLAVEVGVRDIVQSATNFEFRNAERGSPATSSRKSANPAPPPRSAPTRPEPEQPAIQPEAEPAETVSGEAPETAGKSGDGTPPPPPPGGPAPSAPRQPRRVGNDKPFGDLTITYDQVCEILLKPVEKSRYRAVILGLATAGKTFFVQRLARSLGGNYALLNYWGGVAAGGSRTDRTQGVVYYNLNSTDRSQPSIDLFDIPGETFRGLASGDSGGGGSPELPSLYAIMAATDLVIFVEPALEILGADQYYDEGDDFEPSLLEDFKNQVREREAGKPVAERMAEEDVTAQAEQEALKFRRDHFDLAEHFPNNFEAMRIRAVHLRREVSESLRKGDGEAFRAKIAAFMALNFSKLDNKHKPLAIPGLYLLSKADEYQRRAAGGSSDFARDPTGLLTEHAFDRLRVYSRGFELFGVDFITSDPRIDSDAPARHFSGGEGSAGFEGLIKHWIMPALRLTRPAAWWEVWKFGGRRMRSPEAALRLRRLADPEFRKSWNRKKSA